MSDDELLVAAQHVENLTQSDGWRHVKGKLDTRILDLQNINNLDFSNEPNLMFDLKARKMAADILFTWLKDDVYGFAEQVRANAEKKTKDTHDFIERG